MLVRRFLDRLAQAGPAERAEIVDALVRVYLEAPLDAENRAAAATAMTVILDDPAPRVRRAMAEALADSASAPRAIILALAEDQADIAQIVLSRSPILSDSELVDLVGASGERQRVAIARRPAVTVGVAAALVEVSEPSACLALIRNPGAQIAGSSFRRLVARHRKDAAVRGALLERDDLPLTLRHDLIEGLSEALGDLVKLRQWMSPERADRVFREARERSVIDIAQSRESGSLRLLMERLAAERRLTPALVIRAACAGNLQFFEEALSVLSGMPLRRVIALVHDRAGVGFPALYRRTGLPAAALPAFRAIVDTLHEMRLDGPQDHQARRGRTMIERVLTRYQSFTNGEVDEFFALLGRLAAEASREEARAETGGYFRAA